MNMVCMFMDCTNWDLMKELAWMYLACESCMHECRYASKANRLPL